MTTISAKSILASQCVETGARIDTLLLRYPRWIHAEFMTHRAFSRNAASSRAIPIQKQIDAILADPAVPMFWTKNEPGMQGQDGHNEPISVRARYDAYQDVDREEAWLQACRNAVHIAEGFAKAGYHKQVVTRLLEPFSHITVLVTSTEWANFFALRDHPAAEPHIQVLAQQMRLAIDGATVRQIHVSDWHLPFGPAALEYPYGPDALNEAIRLSVARCASTSYKTVDDFDMDVSRADALCDKLASANPMHASPFEHQAQADARDMNTDVDDPWMHTSSHRNFVGLRQLRAMIETGAWIL